MSGSYLDSIWCGVSDSIGKLVYLSLSKASKNKFQSGCLDDLGTSAILSYPEKDIRIQFNDCDKFKNVYVYEGKSEFQAELIDETLSDYLYKFVDSTRTEKLGGKYIRRQVEYVKSISLP